MKRLVLATLLALMLMATAVGPAMAHVPPDTGVGGQDACIANTHEPLDIVVRAPTNDCGQ